ncbi:MAG: hypothetical protein KF765_00965 [Parvibaculaceae bacterium]|nr:hypothetical protein [Parvibaculaceae bacterium]
MIEINVSPARLDEKPVIANLMQLYTHDFSEFWAGTPKGEVDGAGLFPAYPYLDRYWEEESRVPLLLRLGGHVAGFALLNAVSHGGRPVDRNMAEFFILRKHRRGGAGTAAAHAIFDLYPGVWEAAVARRNLAALAFWRRAIASHPRAGDIEEHDIATPAWDGPVIRFRIGNAAP